jgi:hypothetical protein
MPSLPAPPWISPPCRILRHHRYGHGRIHGLRLRGRPASRSERPLWHERSGRGHAETLLLATQVRCSHATDPPALAGSSHGEMSERASASHLAATPVNQQAAEQERGDAPRQMGESPLQRSPAGIQVAPSQPLHRQRQHHRVQRPSLCAVTAAAAALRHGLAPLKALRKGCSGSLPRRLRRPGLVSLVRRPPTLLRASPHPRLRMPSARPPPPAAWLPADRGDSVA